MKIYFKILLFCFLWQPAFCLEKNTYSISVCTTSSKEDANRCKEDILKSSKSEAFVLKNQNETYSTYLGIFTTYDEAKEILNNSSNFIKKQTPFIKKVEKKHFDNAIKQLKNKNCSEHGSFRSRTDSGGVGSFRSRNQFYYSF